jgi:leader peptidase (prepilin peptidase)/N-methyltransferase
MPDMGWLTQPAVFPWAALAVGLCIGSFLNVVIHRLPRMMERAWLDDARSILESPQDERTAWRRHVATHRDPPSRVRYPRLGAKGTNLGGTYDLITPRSSCPACGHLIAAWENIPVLSYVALRGKCSACGAHISFRYPLVETLAGIGAAWSAWHFGFSIGAFGGAFFIWCTIALAFIDHATGYLHDDITLPLLWSGLLLNVFGTFVPLGEAVIGAAAGYLSLWSVYWGYKIVRGVEGMGHGDFKMTAAVGAYLGWKLLPLVIMISALVGLLFGAAQMIAAVGKWDPKFKFHFGPYIAIAGIVAMFWGKEILSILPALKPF